MPQLCDHELLLVRDLGKEGHPAESRKVEFHHSLRRIKSITEMKVKLCYNLLVVQKG